ncbi:extracellular solute-binding protein, family 5 [Rubellimicrobium mesophilum DSM 19309]|uniref:Extracellular solute-binding protein, family 5 n=1 Tax=Rubellimicrobium mesophilum DSM 19309 TaxID=442562 RepID=A0A017HNY5_9RHOB|nr:ABC transporter substrate-binding protein [Rubellimicrobium mesophilum]EYD76212.1 extracellular solute-binding protein, family 5 [Rubellimicrobium mesophilum DSM 19309]
MTHRPILPALPRRRVLQSLAALPLASLLSLPGHRALAQGIREGGDLRAALTGEPDVLDPAVSSIYTGAQVYEGIFSKLIDMDPDGNFVPDLATAWEQTDPTTWTFTLVEGARFHNGEPFTSADVKYSFDRILDPATASAYAGLYGQVASVETPDPRTVAFKLKSAFGPFLTNLAANGHIVNKTAIETGDPARSPVGTGPFAFVEWVQGDHITLKKNPDYFKPGLPHLDSVTFRFMPVDQSRIEALSAGELDWVDAIPLQLVPSLSQDPRFAYVTSPVAGIPDFLAMNTRVAPFDDPRVRQAVALAVDREAIRRVAYLGTGEPGLIEVPTGSQWYDETGVFAATRDVEKAKALLAEAGHGDGLSFEYLGLTQYPELLKTGQVVRELLKEVGIDMAIQAVEVSVWFDAFSSGNYQITSAYQERTIDPDNFYSLVIKSGGPVNTTGYSNPEVDALIDQAAASSDMEERKALYAKIRGIVTQDAPLVFVHYETLNYLMNGNVTGSAITPTLSLHMENVAFTG